MNSTAPTTERLTYSVETAATMLGISRALAYQLVRSGEIPSLKLGRRVVVPRVALAKLVDVRPSSADDRGRQPEQLHLFAAPQVTTPESA